MRATAPDWTAIGDRLRRARAYRLLSQQAVAEQLGVSRDTVRSIERGAGGAARGETLLGFAELVGVDLAALVAEVRSDG